MASVVLQPWMIPSALAPPVMMGGLALPRGAPRVVGQAYLRLQDGIGALLFGRELNTLRASLGLRRVWGVFQWWLSPELVIGLFPDWFGEPQRDWPGQIQLAGFPLHDGLPNRDVPEETIGFCRSGRPPVAFTFGTGMMHAAELFQTALEACRLAGVRGVFLTRFRAQLPDHLPPLACHCEFAPFQKLFPFCAAVVHHGGIGTVAKALAAGTPQLILPFAYDQMDNARRVLRLRAGECLAPGHRTREALAAALQRVVDPQAAVQAKAAAARFNDRSGLQQAGDLLEAFRS